MNIPIEKDSIIDSHSLGENQTPYSKFLEDTSVGILNRPS
jgi:hypothetical protein